MLGMWYYSKVKIKREENKRWSWWKNYIEERSSNTNFTN